MTEADPQSPCISVCRLDERDICQGCFRSAQEIADWLLAGPRGRREILQRAMQRREASTALPQR